MILSLFIVGGCEARDLKGPNARTVVRNAILRKPDNLSVPDDHSARWPSILFIAFDDWTPGMLSPGTQQLIGKVKMDVVVLIGSRAGKHPPPVIKTENRGIGPFAFYQRAQADPVCGKR